MARENSTGVQSVVRALSLLDILASSPTDCSLSDLTHASRLPASTVHRLLTSLLQAGYVSQNPVTARYGLGNNLILLSQRAAQKHELIQIARPHLEALARASGETANLTARFGDNVIQLDHVESPNRLRVSYPLGERFPLHASASGKLFLAYMPEAERERCLRRSRRALTRATVTDLPRLAQELRSIRARGYALDDAEREEGVRCVAAPIHDSRGETAAAISLSGPSLRLSHARLHELAAALTEKAQAITAEWRAVMSPVADRDR